MNKPQYKKITVLVTPLQRIVGFHVSEKTYDLLDFNEQLIIDLKIEGFENITIAQLLGVRPLDIKRAMDRIRLKLANSELKFHLEMKSYYKEVTRPQLDESALKDSFTTQNVLDVRKR